MRNTARTLSSDRTLPWKKNLKNGGWGRYESEVGPTCQRKRAGKLDLGRARARGKESKRAEAGRLGGFSFLFFLFFLF